MRQPEEPFQKVENVEWHKEQLAHLRVVDALVVDHIFVNPRGVSRPVGPEQVDAIPLGHKSAFYLHIAKTLSARTKNLTIWLLNQKGEGDALAGAVYLDDLDLDFLT